MSRPSPAIPNRHHRSAANARRRRGDAALSPSELKNRLTEIAEALPDADLDDAERDELAEAVDVALQTQNPLVMRAALATLQSAGIVDPGQEQLGNPEGPVDEELQDSRHRPRPRRGRSTARRAACAPDPEHARDEMLHRRDRLSGDKRDLQQWLSEREWFEAGQAAARSGRHDVGVELDPNDARENLMKRRAQRCRGGSK